MNNSSKILTYAPNMTVGICTKYLIDSTYPLGTISFNFIFLITSLIAL